MLKVSNNFLRYTLSSRGIQACGESVRLLRTLNLEAVSVKQEENMSLAKIL